MYGALCGEEAIQSRAHTCEDVTDGVRLRKAIVVGEDVAYGEGIRGGETGSAQESSVGVGGATYLLPAKDEVGVLVVVDLGEVSEEEGGCGGHAEVI